MLLHLLGLNSTADYLKYNLLIRIDQNICRETGN